MWKAIKITAAVVCGAIAAFFSSPLFFILLGCSFITASYLVLTKVNACGHLLEMACLEFSQLNLAFGLLAALFGSVLLIYGTALHATHQGQITSVKQVYDEIKSFFGSPIFFILFGTFFLYCALVLLNETHSSFIFILAVLGLAVVLFGTGSHAVASGNLSQPTSGTFSVGIAGGAAALAAIFGFGIVYLEAGIQEFFKRTVDYGFFELTTTGTANQTLDLDEQSVSASTADGRPLHLWKQTGRMQIMVPRYSGQGESSIVLTIKGPRIQASSPPTTYTINWESVRPLATAGNERIYVARQSMTTPLAPTATLLVDDVGRPLPSITIPPPQ